MVVVLFLLISYLRLHNNLITEKCDFKHFQKFATIEWGGINETMKEMITRGHRQFEN